MALATDQQVQTYSDTRIRPRAEQIRGLLNALVDDKGAIDDVYAACAAPNPTWKDNRTDGPPHLLAPSDVLAYNELITTLIAAIQGEPNWAVVEKACVRPVSG